MIPEELSEEIVRLERRLAAAERGWGTCIDLLGEMRGRLLMEWQRGHDDGCADTVAYFLGE